MLVAAAQEERFTRVKNDRSIPRHSFRYCLDKAKLSISDVTCLAYYEDPKQKLSRQLCMTLLPGLSEDYRRSLGERFLTVSPIEALQRLFGYEGAVEIVDHHLSHAASSYYYSGFDEAAILTADGVGEWPTTTYGAGVGATINRLEHVDFPHSLGLFYSTITAYLGFEVNEGEYKVMGLAPYGRPEFVKQIYQMIDNAAHGQFRLNMRYFGFLTHNTMFTQDLIDLLGAPPREPESPLLQFHMDVAHSAQTVLEELLLEKVRYLHRRVPSPNLCLAGGVALNVVATSRCLREGPFDHLFVQPAAGDAGGALGAAAAAHFRMTGERPDNKRMTDVYLGPANSSEDIFALLQAASAPHRDYRDNESGLLRYVVDKLEDGKVIGWSSGRMEFGPRALGARSILADPRRPEMKDRINEVVKMREGFRPFAPAVLEQFADKHFEIDHPSPFMLETCQVRSPIAIPAVTHVDGSSRVQTVDGRSHPRFAALLELFYRRTGCPILLNTSFNVRGQPIVCTALDAIRCFVSTRMDVLVLEDFVLDRTSIPPLWELEASQFLPAAKGSSMGDVGHVVYTLF
jgi:carbamoyltransferase